jgi:hypothetical protein
MRGAVRLESASRPTRNAYVDSLLHQVDVSAVEQDVDFEVLMTREELGQAGIGYSRAKRTAAVTRSLPPAACAARGKRRFLGFLERAPSRFGIAHEVRISTRNGLRRCAARSGLRRSRCRLAQ